MRLCFQVSSACYVILLTVYKLTWSDILLKETILHKGKCVKIFLLGRYTGQYNNLLGQVTQMTKVRTSASGENYTHRILWVCAQKQLEVAKAEPPGNWYFRLTAMLMAYFTYEAYLNFLGDRIDKDTWAKEKVFFSKHPYRGTEGKLLKLQEVLGMPPAQSGSRPYATISELASLRNTVAHGKPEQFTIGVQHSSNRQPSNMKPWLRDRVTRPNAERAFIDVEQFVNAMHAQAVEKVGSSVVQPHALRGSLAFSLGTTTAVP